MKADDAGSVETLPWRHSKKIVIMGANGRMGSMLAQKGKACGFKIAELDLPYPENLQEFLAHTSLIILCVPASHLEETLEKVTPHLPSYAILSDITSVKEEPMRLMRQYWSGDIVGTHPLFGPIPNEKEDLPVVIVPELQTGGDAVHFVENFFEKLGFRTFIADAESHDKAMAKIQNLNFITNVAYFAALAEEKELIPFLTPSFGRRQLAAKKMLTEDADMFSGLFEANPHSHEAVRQFRKFLNIAASGDIDLLCKRAQWWWDDKPAGAENHD